MRSQYEKPLSQQDEKTFMQPSEQRERCLGEPDLAAASPESKGWIFLTLDALPDSSKTRATNPADDNTHSAKFDLNPPLCVSPVIVTSRRTMQTVEKNICMYVVNLSKHRRKYLYFLIFDPPFPLFQPNHRAHCLHHTPPPNDVDRIACVCVW